MVRIPSRLWGVRRDATAADMREYLGLARNAKLPAEGMPEREVHGVLVYVAPLNPATSRRRLHRIYAICTCGTHVPAGRLHQHRCR